MADVFIFLQRDTLILDCDDMTLFVVFELTFAAWQESDGGGGDQIEKIEDKEM